MSDLALLNASLIQQLLGSAALKHISGSYLLLFGNLSFLKQLLCTLGVKQWLHLKQ